jgi:D-3-phosphoglycerate dehydrogenase
MAKTPDILVAVDLTHCPDALEPLRRAGRVEYIAHPEQDQIEAIIAGFDAYMGHTNVRVTEALLAAAARLRVVCTCSTGTDHIDMDALKRRDLPLISLTTEHELLDTFTSTAEMAWLLLQSCRRRLPHLLQRAGRGEIGPDPAQPPAPQLSGKTLGIVGYGRLGKMVTEYGLAFRMRVLICDPYKTVDRAGVEQVDFETLLRTCDVISLHVHLSDQTRHMIDRDALARMKRGVVIVNVARGDLICEEALLEALSNGHVAAAGLDVVHDEWDANLAARPLLTYARTHDNLILTPHVAGGSLESIVDARRFIARKLAEFLGNP